MKQLTGPEVPTTESFRAWVLAACQATNTKPATLSRSIDAGVNLVSMFLRNPERDITLSRAAALERCLREIAKKQGVVLPPIRRTLEGGK